MRGEPGIGTEFGNYRLEELLSRGGMGVVYVAEDVRMGRTVALKLIAAEYAENEAFRTRFLHESRVAGAINHPNVILVYDAGEHDGLLYIAMRYVEGTDLRGLLDADAPLELARAVSIVSQSAAALAATHARGLIHRDVKPANILLVPRTTEDGADHVYLSDFGLAKNLGSLSGPTRTEQFMGTVGYVAPEQIRGKGVERRTDVYALGCVLFDCLTGMAPFARNDDFATIMAHVDDAPPHVAELRPGVPEAVEAVVQRALAKAPEDRFEDCDAMGIALRRAAGRSGTTPLPAPEEKVASRGTVWFDADAEKLSAGRADAAFDETAAGSPPDDPLVDRDPAAAAAAASRHRRRLRPRAHRDRRLGATGREPARRHLRRGAGAARRALAAAGAAAASARCRRRCVVVVVVDNKIIVTGGQANGRLVEETEILPGGTRWLNGADLPTPREHLAAVSDGRFVYAVGGRDLSADSNTRALERYDVRDDRWAKLPSMPIASGSLGAAILEGRLVAVGGEDSTRVIDAVQSYDLGSRRWSQLDALPTPRHGLGVAAFGDALYALGGALGTGHLESTNTVEALGLK